MKQLSMATIEGLANDIQVELYKLERLAKEIATVRHLLSTNPEQTGLYYENLAFKLHNFYTGCEHIFQMIADELNGFRSDGFEWHKRLLERMGIAQTGRPAVLSAHSVAGLREYLAFRHVVRNLYGFELDSTRVHQLVERYPTIWAWVSKDLHRFLDWHFDLAATFA